MSTPGQVAGATQQAAGQTVSVVKDEAAQTAYAAKSAAVDIAGTAKDQVGQVAGEAISQVKQLVDQARTQAGAQAEAANQKLTETVRRLAGELRDLGHSQGDGSGTVSRLAQQLADKGEQFATYLDQHGPTGVLHDVRGFAARKPGTFLLGSVAAGMATGRVVKGATAPPTQPAKPGPATDATQTYPSYRTDTTFPTDTYGYVEPADPVFAPDPYPAAPPNYTGSGATGPEGSVSFDETTALPPLSTDRFVGSDYGSAPDQGRGL